MSKNVIIIGATSGIAEAVSRVYAQLGSRFFLVARDSTKLQVIAADLKARGAKDLKTFELDANNYGDISKMFSEASQFLTDVDVVLIAHGTLPDQALAEKDIEYAVREFRTNSESVISCMTEAAKILEPQGFGVLAVIGSVAGDRGRGSNYLYGAAKAAVETFASGLRARLFKKGVHVLLIKPGFVATAMTANLQLPEKLTVQPAVVAKDIHQAIEKKRDVIYTPWFWRWIMLVIRWLPMPIFKRMKL